VNVRLAVMAKKAAPLVSLKNLKFKSLGRRQRLLEHMQRNRSKGKYNGCSGHPSCIQGKYNDCIGKPMDFALQHVLPDGQLGDVYCASCYETFVQRAPELMSQWRFANLQTHNCSTCTDLQSHIYKWAKGSE
jgi:hypothetical protein